MHSTRWLLCALVLVACTEKESAGDDRGDGTTEPRWEGSEPGDCDDGADNDRDGLYDCDDDGCVGSPVCEEDSGDVPTNDGDGDGYDSLESGGTDCDDTDGAVNPGAAELCNDQDDDCDGDIDEEPIDGTAWYADSDGDGFGDPDTEVSSCDPPSGTVADDQDCDDGDAAVSPDADEVCNEQDDDCDGTTDEDPLDGDVWYADEDGDGYGNSDATEVACTQPSGMVADASDCDDDDDAISPMAVELCNGIDDDCDEVEDGKAVPGDYSSIQAAIDDASVGDLICVGAGTWTEKLDFGGKDLRVVSEGGSSSTTLDGSGGSGPVVTLTGGESTVAELSGFSIEVAELYSGGAVYIDGAGVTLRDIVVSNQVDRISDDPFGGVLHVASGALVLEDSAFDANELSVEPTGDDDGRLRGGVVYLDDATATFTNVEFTDNRSEVSAVGYAGVYGAAVYASSSELTMADVAFSGNAGVAISDGLQVLNGGALYVADESILHVENSSFDRNSLTGQRPADGSYLYGGAVYTETSEVVLTDVQVTNNSLNGAASLSSYAFGGGMTIYAGEVTADHLVVTDNSVTCEVWGYAGGLLLYPNTVADLTNLVVAGNQLDAGSGIAYGGGIHVQVADTVHITNADVVANALTGGSAWGGGLLTTTGSTLTLTNVNIIENSVSATGSAHGSAIFQNNSIGSGSLSISYGNVYGNTGGSSDFFNMTDPTGSDGNVSVDPEYVDTSGSDAALWDLSLASASACVDAGDPAILDADGTTSDIGSRGGPDAAW